MKKRITLAGAILLLLSLTAIMLLSRGGNTWNVERIIGASEYFHYTEAEIEAAMDVVERKFRRDFEDCTLLRLEYDEDKTMVEQVKRGQNYGVKRTIILISDFRVGANADGSLNPDDTYKDWTWILTDEGDGWELRTWGYG